MTSKWITLKNTQSNFTLISLITFEVLNQTSPNLQWSCRNTWRWCLQNYMKNRWELTCELTSKWMTFKNIQSNFTLISLITFEVPNQTSSNLHGCCRNTCRWCLQITCKTVENCRLHWRRNEWLLKIFNKISH